MSIPYLSKQNTVSILRAVLADNAITLCQRKDASRAAAAGVSRLAVDTFQAHTKYLCSLVDVLCGEVVAEKLPIPDKLAEHLVLIGMLQAVLSILVGGQIQRAGGIAGSKSLADVIHSLPEKDRETWSGEIDDISSRLDTILSKMADLYDSIGGIDQVDNEDIKGLLKEKVAPALHDIKVQLERVDKNLDRVMGLLAADWQFTVGEIRADTRCS